MSMNFFQRRRVLKKLNTLEATPVRCCKHETDTNGNVHVIVPKFKSEWINEVFLQRRPRNFKVKLDRFGSAGWLLIDGTRTVEAICREMEAQFGEEVRPIEERLSKFISLLYEQRYITFKELS